MKRLLETILAGFSFLLAVSYGLGDGLYLWSWVKQILPSYIWSVPVDPQLFLALVFGGGITFFLLDN